MSKKEFMKKLSRELDKLPKGEREKTLAYYDELIEDRKEAGSTEEAAVDAMGDVKTIASDILTDAKERGVELKRRGMPVGAKIAVIIVSVLVGLSLIGGIVWAAFVATGFKEVGEFRQVIKEYEISNDGHIDVNFSQYDLYLGQSEDEKVHISYYENEDLMTFTVAHDEEHISLVQSQKWYAWMFFNKGNRQAVIQVPASFTGSIRTTVSTGDTRVDGLVSPTELDIGGATGDVIVYDTKSDSARFHATTGDLIIGRCSFAEDLSAACTTGDINLEHTSAKNMTVKVSTGDIEIQTVASLDFIIYGTTGDVTVEELNAGSAEIGCSTGDINLKKITVDKLYAHLTTGEIVLNDVDAKDIELKSTTGSINGSLVGSITDYTIESHVSTGKCNLPDGFGSGERKLKVTATTGDIRISFMQD